MTLRTPRRRISPRTKRRYRAIKDFLRRAIGSPSQPDIKINSSIAINVTDLKHKIVGLEHQLSEVNKHCQDLVCVESSSIQDSQTLLPDDDRAYSILLKEQTDVSSSTKRSNAVETTLLYKTSESHYRKSDDCASLEKVNNDANGKHTVKSNDMAPKPHATEEIKFKKKSKMEAKTKAYNGSQPNLHKHKTQSVDENFVSSYSTSSYHSLMDPRASHGYKTRYHDKKHKHREYVEPEVKVRKQKNHVKRSSPERVTENYELKPKRKNRITRDLDQEFIADIIKRQYRPVKMFGKRKSDLTQFSAPICRDQETPIRDTIIEGSEICSCCIDEENKSRFKYEHDLNDMRSICDTRLYSSKRQMRQKHHKRQDIYKKYHDVYNDSEQYDLIPVKEKPSPKLRRKIAVEETIPYNYYKEVPPSPKSQRPKLNLKAQYYTEFEDYLMHRQELRRNRSPQRYRNNTLHDDNIESNDSSVLLEIRKEKRKSQLSKNANKESNLQRDAGTMSSLQSPMYNNEQSNITNDSTLNKTQDTDSSIDKTDKALSEIKDILQNFLQEIKKESTVSQCDNSDIITKTGDKCLNEFNPDDSTKLNTTMMMPNSGVSMNNFGIPQSNVPPNYIPPFANPCCFPMLPVCPMNCLQNGYMLPSPSFTCACVNNSKEGACSKHTTESNESQTAKTATETEELIKEIYKFVAQNSNINNQKEEYKEKKPDSPKSNDKDDKILTSRSVGGSSKHSQHDAKVGTQKIKCYSKSCEAIGSRMTSDTYYTRTNPTYSDTVLEKLSIEVTASDTESEISSESTTHVKQHKQNRFSKVLRSFGFLKKKKDIIEELSENEGTVEVDIEPNAPFRQDVTNYVMHGQEYYERPPIPGHNDPFHSSQEHCQGYTNHTHCHAGCPGHESPMHAAVFDNCHVHKMPHEHGTASPFHSPRPHPSAPPYPNFYDVHHNQPQVPLCLKEIEVKSIATQSERKISFFRKFTKKMQAPAVSQKMDDSGARNCSTQTAGQALETKPNNKPGKFNWKALQAKVNELDKPDKTFSYKTQTQLAEGDTKIRNAMLKKLFNKRNPFSPRNLIVRTILGKDKSSFGEPPAMYRPRMFL